ncbi:MAG: hypothetical protein U0575_06105 [Phycisphaerales bacterium]
MPAGFGSIALPISILLMVLRQRGPVQAFVKAAAVSADTARRPSSLGIHSEYMIEPLVRSGLLVSTGDGRYFVDQRVVRRRARITYGMAGVLALVGVACAAWMIWGRSS